MFRDALTVPLPRETRTWSSRMTDGIHRPAGQVGLHRSPTKLVEQLLAASANVVTGHHQPQLGQLTCRERNRLECQTRALQRHYRAEQEHLRRTRRQRR